MKEENAFINNLNKVTKLNKLAMSLIIVLYCLLVGTVIILMNGKYNYTIKINAKECFDEQVNPYTLIMCKNSASTNDSDEVSYTSNYYVYTIIDTKNEERYLSGSYDMAVTTKENKMIYFDGITYSSLPATKQRMKFSRCDSSYSYTSDSHTSLKNIGIDAIYGTLKYLDENDQQQTLTYMRNTLSLTDKDMKNATSDNKYEDLFTVNLRFTSQASDKTYYYYRYDVNVNDLSAKYKIDTQVFAVTKDGKVLDLCGMYNYSDDDANLSTNGNTTGSEYQVANSLNVKTFYAKVRYYTSIKDYKEVVLKFDYSSIVAEYSNI